MPVPDEEQNALLRDITRSPQFVGARLRIDLLKYLFDRRYLKEGASTKQILDDLLPHLKGSDTAPKGKESTNRYEDGLSAVRHQCRDLREALIHYNTSEAGRRQRWRCELPRALPREGYKLRLINQEKVRPVTLGFWWAHLRPIRDIKVIYNEPLFYRSAASMVFRFVDTKMDEMNAELAVQRLKQDHPDLYTEGVYATRPYLLTGEIEARDCLDEWFAGATDFKISKIPSRWISQADIDESSPILLGNTRTNQFMRDILREDGQGLHFQIYPDRFGVVEIRNPNPDETQCLQTRYPKNVQQVGETLVLQDQPQHDVFAVVTRIPNPSGEGAVTMICSDFTRCLGQVARTLTDDERLSEILKQIEWPPERHAPTRFQLLLAVRLRGAEANKPDLLAWRPHVGQ